MASVGYTRSIKHLALCLCGALCIAASGAPSASQRLQGRALADTMSNKLDRLGLSLETLEGQAYELSARRFYQDAEDAEGARAGFYSSSIKVFRLAVDADSSNARALYHLGLVLVKKSYSGFGVWDSTMGREAIAVLQRAKFHALGVYAPLTPAITRALLESQHNLSAR